MSCNLPQKKINIHTQSKVIFNFIFRQTVNGRLPEKVFIARDSLLTELFKNKHIKTVYHFFAAFFIGLVVDIVAKDYLKNGE